MYASNESIGLVNALSLSVDWTTMDRRHLKDHALRMNGCLPGIEKRKKTDV